MSVEVRLGSFVLEDCQAVIFSRDGILFDFEAHNLNYMNAIAQRLSESLSANSAQLFAWREAFLRASGIDPSSGKISALAPFLCLGEIGEIYVLAATMQALAGQSSVPIEKLEDALKQVREAYTWVKENIDHHNFAKPLSKNIDSIKELGGLSIDKFLFAPEKNKEDLARDIDLAGLKDKLQPLEGKLHPARTLLIGYSLEDYRLAQKHNLHFIYRKGLLNLKEIPSFSNFAEISWQSQEENEDSGQTVTLRTDGASRGNPGEAAIAYAIFDREEKILQEYSQVIGKHTNNYAEYLALIEGLKAIVQLQPKKVQIEMDSELIVKQIRKEYKVKDEVLKELHKQASSLLCKLKGSWSIAHIPRALNKVADALCNQALDKEIGAGHAI